MTREDGFSLVELLVVVLVVGVLAALALPALLGQEADAREAVDRTAERNAVSVCLAAADLRDDAAVTACTP